MKLSDLMSGVPEAEFGADPDLEIRSLDYDSRRVERGGVFFAIHGEKADGHTFIPQVLARGVVAIVSERPSPGERTASSQSTVPWIRVPRIRRALSEASRAFYSHPEQALRLVGITGTNGKTTTAYLLESIFQAAGLTTGMFGTIEYHVAGRTLPAVNTTPESLDLVRHLAELVRARVSTVVMEVSSHALAQERVWGFPFAAAIFTNLTRDHLDYHLTMEDYFQSKRRLFEGIGAPAPALAAININDPWGARLLELAFARLVTFGMGPEANVRPKQSSTDASCIRATLLTPEGPMEIEPELSGRPNLMNIMAAVAAAQGLGIAGQAIEQGIKALRHVPGRFERVEAGQPFLVVVDYAHTDDALRNVLTTARELTRRRLIVVFGCGGDRDRSKRPLMGEAAGSLADVVVLTSDNPRSEDPLAIINDALVGVQKTGKPFILEPDRATAIREALDLAHDGDTVVIAGKGHETYQVFRDGTVPFDDREVARQVLASLGYTGSVKAGTS